MHLNELTARVSILDLYARYTHALDAGDGERFADCFTADGFTDISSFPTVDTLRQKAIPWLDADGTIRGREQLKLAVSGNPHGAALHHCTLNVLVKSIEGDTARSAAYFVVFAPDTGAVEHYGIYEDKLCRAPDGRWRIQERIDKCLYERRRVSAGEASAQ